jgi:hypothetical protein
VNEKAGLICSALSFLDPVKMKIAGPSGRAVRGLGLDRLDTGDGFDSRLRHGCLSSSSNHSLVTLSSTIYSLVAEKAS